MERRFNISAAQMVLLSGFGAVLACSGFVLMGFIPRLIPRSSAAFIPSLFLCLALVIAGFGISMSSESRLQNGIAAERWPEEKIAELRRLIMLRLWFILSVVCIIAFAAGLFFRPSSPLRGFAWCGFIFSMLISRLRTALVPRPISGPPNKIDWGTGTPLRSEHWGER